MLKCDQCDREFLNYKGLNGHKRVHGKSKGKRAPISTKHTGIVVSCGECGEDFKRRLKKHRFCSTRCASTNNWKQVHLPRVLDGTAGILACKTYLLQEHGNVCSKCELGNWNGEPLVMHMDHIDGNSDNNILDNLRLLCPNCHSQTDTYCGRNVAKLKDTKRNKYKRKYYQQSVS